MSEVRAAAGRNYPASEASGGQEETPHVCDQGRPGEATSRPRSGTAARRSHPRLRPGPAAGRSNLKTVAEQAQEGLEDLSHVKGQER